ncbi:MAG: hypothetical protein AAFQ87_24385 [Bacteroidota bacterium]
MKSIIITLFGLLVFVSACTPDPLPCLKLANLIGNWDATSSYRYWTEDGLGEQRGRKEFQMGIQEDQRLWFLDEMTTDTVWGKWRAINSPNTFPFSFELKPPALDSLLPQGFYGVSLSENRTDALSLYSYYSTIVDGQRISVSQNIELTRMP